MEYVLVSVICSVLVSIILKWARLKNLDTRQMIMANYPVAVLCSYVFFPPQWDGLFSANSPWVLYLSMAFLLPILFLILSASLKHAGLVITEVAQRISLVIPLMAAFFIFREQFEAKSLIAVGLGLLSIVLCIGWHKANPEMESKQSKLIHFLPFWVFLGYGIVDVLFKKVAQNSVVPYTTSMLLIFMGACFVALIYMLVLFKQKTAIFSMKSISLGLLLGVFNFFNILFYMKAHQALPEQPSLVFTGMNIGVIALGVLAGRFLFQERPSRMNYLGVALAMVAVLIIASRAFD